MKTYYRLKTQRRTRLKQVAREGFFFFFFFLGSLITGAGSSAVTSGGGICLSCAQEPMRARTDGGHGMERDKSKSVRISKNGCR